jgi:hypothetical protein
MKAEAADVIDSQIIFDPSSRATVSMWMEVWQSVDYPRVGCSGGMERVSERNGEKQAVELVDV